MTCQSRVLLLAGLILSAASVLRADEKSNLLFHASFDKATRADIARGKADPVTENKI